jgi:radical SAM enzyme (TIGR01210 family)
VPASLSSRRIRQLRPPKGFQDPSTPAGAFWEDERLPEGGVLPVLTMLLTGAECRFTCVYCDLWRATLDGRTPAGSVPRQIRETLARIGTLPAVSAVKLYNHSNYFDARAVPPGDVAQVAALVAPFTRVTVECHPTLVGRRCLEFARRVNGTLEIAMGLETADPAVLARLNKQMTLADFDAAADLLRSNGIGIRAFVLVSPPFVRRDDIVPAAVRSVEYALARGAQHVSLIPVRGGNGVMEELERAGDFVPPRLSDLEGALERCLARREGVVTADLWDARSLVTCGRCGPARLDRIARMNLTGRVEPRLSCDACEAA